MSKVEWIEHKGKRILYTVHSGSIEDDMIESLRLSDKMIDEENAKDLLLLADYTDSFGTQKYMSAVRDFGKRRASITKKTAVLGITGPKKVLLMGYSALTGGNIQPFNTKEEALDWLVE